ncbi:hypothetical protein M885DRAFT_492215 [Pelagophyceae sp. CCMP2097]|nr:hypothetical protein M885DRAFT_492215 [Pelagophyceae sp. CCMP2097]
MALPGAPGTGAEGVATLELEEAAARCGECGAELYLDADPGLFKCAPCETRGAAVGERGTAVLGDGAFVNFYNDDWLDGAQSDDFKAIEAECRWQCAQDAVALGDACSTVSQPRLIAYEASGLALLRPYSYPGLVAALEPAPFAAAIERLRHRVEFAVFGADKGFFNAAHLNLYRSGADHVSWHTDEDVPLYGDRPIIASVSLGAPRDFVLRRCVVPGDMVAFTLPGGALLVMHGATQTHWTHSVRKAQGAAGARINVTFRRVLPADAAAADADGAAAAADAALERLGCMPMRSYALKRAEAA